MKKLDDWPLYDLRDAEQFAAWTKRINGVSQEAGSWWFTWGERKRATMREFYKLICIGSQTLEHGSPFNREEGTNTLLKVEEVFRRVAHKMCKTRKGYSDAIHGRF